MVVFWVSVLALSILLYVLLDGSDLGVGILYGLTSRADRRSAMMASVAPVWDGNETWLIVAAVVLWGAFPFIYATLLSAFYLPILLMLAGLILRGVAFEFRSKALRLPGVWDACFAGGSMIAAFMQGLMMGALVAGLPISHGQYSGGEFGWLSPFSLLCGAGLCMAYSLLGACWLVSRCDGELRSSAYRLIPALSVGLAVILVLVFVFSLTKTPRVMDRWLERPYLFLLPILGLVSAVALAVGVRRRRNLAPGYAATATFVAAFTTFVVTFWPYMIPFSITFDQAAAPSASLSFMFWGEGLFVLPLMLGYTFINLRVFRGKRPVSSYHF